MVANGKKLMVKGNGATITQCLEILYKSEAVDVMNKHKEKNAK